MAGGQARHHAELSRPHIGMWVIVPGGISDPVADPRGDTDADIENAVDQTDDQKQTQENGDEFLHERWL